LNERNLVKIYASGFSRIPIYRSDINKGAICGVLITKQLIGALCKAEELAAQKSQDDAYFLTHRISLSSRR